MYRRIGYLQGVGWVYSPTDLPSDTDGGRVRPPYKTLPMRYTKLKNALGDEPIVTHFSGLSERCQGCEQFIDSIGFGILESAGQIGGG